MSLPRILAALLIVAGAVEARSGRAEWIGSAGQRVKAEIFRSTDAASAPVLVVVLHGDSPLGKPTYQYDFAASASKKIRGIVAAALLRPGYTDGEGDKSDGNAGDRTGDNYTPEVVDQLDAAIRHLKLELHPSAVVLVGHSGGAALSADLIARDSGLANAALLVSCPCDVPAWRRHMKTLYPSPRWDEHVRSVSPVDVVNRISQKTRVWMVVGEKDNVAPLDFTQRYAAALQKHGIKPAVTVLPGRDHEIFLDSAVMQELSKLIADLH